VKKPVRSYFEAMDGNTDTIIEEETNVTFHGWKYKHHFVIVEVGKKNIGARCKLSAGNKTLSCARNTN